MSSILYEILVSITKYKSNSRDFGNYSTLAYLISEKKAELSAEDLLSYIARVKEEFGKLISHQILAINSSMVTRISRNNIVTQRSLQQLLNRIYAAAQISSKEIPFEILFIFLINANKLEELLSYIQELSYYIIYINLENGQVKTKQTFTPQVTQIRVINQNVYDYMINSLFDSGLIIEDANRGGISACAYEVTSAGRNFFNEVTVNLNRNGSASMSNPVNYFNNNIGSVSQLNQGNNDNSNQNTVNNVQIMTNQVFQSIVNGSDSTTLTEDEKEKLLALNNNDTTFASRFWELLNSAVNGVASGIASSIAG